MSRSLWVVLLLAAAPARAQEGSDDAQLRSSVPGAPSVPDISGPVTVAIQGSARQAPQSITIPTSAGMVRLDVRPREPTAREAAEALRAGERKQQWITGALAIASVLLLAGSVMLRKKPVQPAPAEPAAGPGGYPIVRILGAGGMGVVYEAVDRSLDRRVAIKRMRDEIRSDPVERQRFIKEAKTVAALHHPAIVDIHGIVEQGGEVYLVFEYVEGKTVEQLLRERGRLPLAEAKRILEPVCQALEFAHGRNVVHRDLKPANVMVTAQGFVKVMDFGIARAMRESLARVQGSPGPAALAATNTVVGTPLYMAPEAERGLVGPASDLFSLGVMAYELLSGEPPFPPPASAEQKLTRSYVPLAQAAAGLPAPVSALIDEALEPDCVKRLASARAFWGRLAPL